MKKLLKITTLLSILGFSSTVILSCGKNKSITQKEIKNFRPSRNQILLSHREENKKNFIRRDENPSQTLIAEFPFSQNLIDRPFTIADVIFWFRSFRDSDNNFHTTLTTYVAIGNMDNIKHAMDDKDTGADWKDSWNIKLSFNFNKDIFLNPTPYIPPFTPPPKGLGLQLKEVGIDNLFEYREFDIFNKDYSFLYMDDQRATNHVWNSTQNNIVMDFWDNHHLQPYTWYAKEFEINHAHGHSDPGVSIEQLLSIHGGNFTISLDGFFCWKEDDGGFRGPDDERCSNINSAIEFKNPGLYVNPSQQPTANQRNPIDISE